MKISLNKLITILSYLTFVLFVSCSEEIYENHEHSHSVDKSKISLSQFKKETKIKDFKTVLEAPITSNNELYRTAELSEFVIDTVAIQKYVSENNKTTYSFRIYTTVNYGIPDEKYNLVYTKENEVWEKSIVAFKEIVGAQPTENQFEGFEKLYDSRMANITTNSISPTEVCITESYTFNCQGCTGVCDLCPVCVTRTVTVSFCPSSGDGTPSDPGQNPGDIGLLPSGSSEHESFVFTPNMYENPVFNDQNYINLIKTQQFFEHLEYSEKVWITASNENTYAYHQLISYLIQNNWAQEKKDFVNNIIDMVVENFIVNNEQPQEQQILYDEIINATLAYLEEFGDNQETRETAIDFVESLFEEEAENVDDVILLTPPSCESFNFTSPSSTINWQQSAVANIHFTVLVGTPSGVFVNHVIEYPTPILFGMPKNLAVGNTNISPGLAATLSAAALNKAIKETVKKYGNKNVSYLIVEQYFESRLKHNFEIGIPGARLNLHPQSYPTPTQYQTNASGLGNCQ